MKRSRVLVDCKVHGVGGLARRATATTIWTAWVVLPGLVTETVTVPALAMSAAAIAAVSCCAVTWVVARCAPFQFTTALLLNLLPLTVKVKAEAPAVALFGTIAATTGTIAGCGADCWGEL